MLFKQYSMRQKAEMASVAQGEAKCYISTKAECFILSMACSRAVLFK